MFQQGLQLTKEDEQELQLRLQIPPEIVKQGAVAMAAHMENQLLKGAVQLNEARLIILGDKGVGKTCLARRLQDSQAPMTREDESTPGVDLSLWEPPQTDLRIHIWDFAGHVVTHAVHPYFLSERCLYVVVCDGRTEQPERLTYWLEQIQRYGNDSRIMVLVNERDGHRVSLPQRCLKEAYPGIQEQSFFFFSLKDPQTKLDVFRQQVVRLIQGKLVWTIDGGTYAVKTALEQRFEQGSHRLSRQDFDRIAQQNEVKDPDQLLKNLHALGISLWFEQLKKFQTLILNPAWLSEGLYQIINWVYQQGKHQLWRQDLATVFAKESLKYPQDCHDYLGLAEKVHWTFCCAHTGRNPLRFPPNTV